MEELNKRNCVSSGVVGKFKHQIVGSRDVDQVHNGGYGWYEKLHKGCELACAQRYAHLYYHPLPSL